MTEDQQPAAPAEKKFVSIADRPVRTDEELKQIAVDLLAGRIFTDRHFRSTEEWQSLIRSVFMVLAFMETDALKDMGDHCAMIFEYFDKAGPRSINGYPSFMSFQIILKTEIDRLFQYYEAMKQMQTEFTLPPAAVPG